MINLHISLPIFGNSPTRTHNGHGVTSAESGVRRTTPGCRDHLSESEYQRLVELGHWHHNRQRRRDRRY